VLRRFQNCYRSGLNSERSAEKRVEADQNTLTEFQSWRSRKDWLQPMCCALVHIVFYVERLIRLKRKQGRTKVNIQTEDIGGNN